MREDWNEVKVEYMTKIVEAKFTQHPELALRLLETGDKLLNVMKEEEIGIAELSRISGVQVPNAIEEIRNAKVRHNTVCEVNEMTNVVKEFLGI